MDQPAMRPEPVKDMRRGMQDGEERTWVECSPSSIVRPTVCLAPSTIRVEDTSTLGQASLQTLDRRAPPCSG